jgi:hypothetical protein
MDNKDYLPNWVREVVSKKSKKKASLNKLGFNVEVEVEDDLGNLWLVTGDVSISSGLPARGPSYSGGGDPAEPSVSEIGDIKSVMMIDEFNNKIKKTEADIPASIQDKVYEALEDAAEKEAENYEPDYPDNDTD